MHVNKPVIVAVIGISAISIVRLWAIPKLATASTANTKPVTPILMGAYVVLVVAALLDLFGGQLSIIVGRICLLALLTVILTQFPWSVVTQWLGSAQAKQKAS